MNTGEPRSAAEFAELHALRQRIAGYGIGQVTMHMPCPFCAAQGWLIVKVVDVGEELARGGRCGTCARSARFERTDHPDGGITIELVQTGGRDAPEWMEHPPRRIDGEASP